MAKKKNSVQALIGLERFTRYGLKTDKAELVLFAVEPTNVSVLSDANIGIKIHDLMMVLSVIPDLELIATDSAEQFDDNKAFIRQRLETEQNEAIRKLLKADYAFPKKSKWCPRRVFTKKYAVSENSETAYLRGLCWSP